jgi:hypothetical protein
MTSITRPSFHSLRSRLTSSTTFTSAVFPGHTQHLTGMPSRVTAKPITTCARFGRESLLCPASASQRRPRRRPRRRRIASLVAVIAGDVLVLALDLEVRRGGVQEEQVDLQVEEVGDAPEHLPLDLVMRLEQEVHRAVQLMHVDLREALDVRFIRHPRLDRELAAGIERPVRHQREQEPLDRGAVPALGQQLLQPRRDPEPLPHAIEQVGAAEVLGAQEARVQLDTRRGADLGRLGGIEVPRDARHQPPQGLDIQLVLAAEREQHPRA